MATFRNPVDQFRQRVLPVTAYAMSLEEVAAELGCSVQSTHETERRALYKAKRQCALRGLTFQDFLDSLTISTYEPFNHPAGEA